MNLWKYIYPISSISNEYPVCPYLVLRTLGNNLTAEKIANLSPSPKSARKLLPSVAVDSPPPPSSASKASSQEKELATLRKEVKQKSELVRSDFQFPSSHQFWANQDIFGSKLYITLPRGLLESENRVPSFPIKIWPNL